MQRRRKVCVCCLPTIVWTPLPTPTVFPFWGFTVWEDQDDPVGARMINSHTIFGSKSIFTTQSSLYDAWSLPAFWLSCFISRGWSVSEPSRLSAAMCWTLSKPVHPPLGRSGGEKKFRNKFCRRGRIFATAMSPFLKLYIFLFVYLSPPPPH